MRLVGIIDEDFVNYKEPSMVLNTCYCTFKCDFENGRMCCQNSELANAPKITVEDDVIISRYLGNPITKAIVFGGLEPFEQFKELKEFIGTLRNNYHCNDTVVIYTGYKEHEIKGMVAELSEFKNIIIKFGRFVPDQPSHYDEVLGIKLASPGQYTKRIGKEDT